MAHREDEPKFNWFLAILAGLFLAALVGGGDRLLKLLESSGFEGHLPVGESAILAHPFADLLKMIVACVVGMLVTAVHVRFHGERPVPRSLRQAQVLLCLAGAVVMIIIGNSVARAFGVAGAAGIVRFRTPVEDPKDTTLLFLLVTLGMACGIGQLALAGLGALFLCAVLAALDRLGESSGRKMILSAVASGSEFPEQHVHKVLGSTVDFYEVREVIRGSEAIVKYFVLLSPTAPLSWLSSQLMADGTAGLKSVTWQEPGKKGNG